jgi:ribonuclease P protein component
MLAKKFHLSRKDNIKEIVTKGTELRSPYFIIKMCPAAQEPTKFAIVVSAKISKKAVERNKLRRQIYEIIRLNLNEFSPSDPRKIVILTRTRTLNMTYKTLETELKKLLTNSNRTK